MSEGGKSASRMPNQSGPPATISSLRQQGLVAFTVMCDAGECANQKRVLFDDLGMPDTVPFLEIKAWRRFRCGRCGSRRFRLAPDWTDHVAQGDGKRPVH